jgi:hypothetical protein
VLVENVWVGVKRVKVDYYQEIKKPLLFQQLIDTSVNILG